jgi:hypothetical protein
MLAVPACKVGQGESARELYEQSLAIAQRLADDKPGNTTYRRDLSVSFSKLADLAPRGRAVRRSGPVGVASARYPARRP